MSLHNSNCTNYNWLVDSTYAQTASSQIFPDPDLIIICFHLSSYLNIYQTIPLHRPAEHHVFCLMSFQHFIAMPSFQHGPQCNSTAAAVALIGPPTPPLTTSLIEVSRGLCIPQHNEQQTIIVTAIVHPSNHDDPFHALDMELGLLLPLVHPV